METALTYDVNGFIQKLEKKLRLLRYPRRNTGRHDLRKLLSSYNDLRVKLEAFGDHAAAAKGLTPDYLRAAAGEAVVIEQNKVLGEAYEVLVHLLNDWAIAKALAVALVNAVYGPSSLHPLEIVPDEKPSRFFIHMVLDPGRHPKEFLQEFAEVLGKNLAPANGVIDEMGWLQGAIGSSDGGGSPDGAYAIISVGNPGVVCEIKGWAEALGASSVSTPQML